MGLGNFTGISCLNRRATNHMLWRVMLLACVIYIPIAALAQSFTFNNVRVEGNQRVQASTIVSYTEIEHGKPVSAGQLNDANRRILDSGLFETVELDPQGRTLVVRVKEFPTINRIRFEGNRRLKDDVLEGVIDSAERRVFSPAQAERDASKLAEAYSQRGRIAARVSPRIIRRSDNRVDLVFEIAEGDTIEVERVSFVGNRAYSDRRLRRVLETKQAGILRTFIRTDTLIEDRIEFDKQVLRDFYLARGYVDFRIRSTNVELTRERDAFFLVMNVAEGQQFKFGEITTVSEIPDADELVFQDSLKIRPGVVYSPVLVENSIARMERLAVRLGIDFLRVEPRITRNDRTLTLDVEFALVRGRRAFVERIDIEGNTTTLDRIVRQQFRVVEGDPFNPREIRESAERIRALGYFEDAEVNAREGSSSDQIIVDVDVKEQPTGSLNFGGSYSVNDGFGVAVGLREDNFLGRGQRLAFNVQTTGEQEQYNFGFTEPFLFGRNLEFGIDLGTSLTESSFVSYATERRFFRPSLTFPISENGELQLRYTWRRNDMETRDSLTNSDLIAAEIAQGPSTESSLGFTYTYDTRTTGLDPNSGFLFELGADVAGLGGDNEYVRTRAKVVGQTRAFNEEVTLRATLEAGALTWRSSNFARTVDRFTIGPGIMRGFEPGGIGPRDTTNGTDDAVGGNYFAVARFEAEFPLGLPEEIGIRGGLFYDIGNVWNIDNADPTATGGVLGAGGSFRQVIGFSVLWDTAIGPLRFNFSQALEKESFDREQSFDLTLQARF